jgi:Mn2+/Fe2+ NRAMP family transporter
MGILGTGLLALPTLAASSGYAASELLGRTQWKQFPVAGVIVAGYLLNLLVSLSAMRALLWAAVVNSLVAPCMVAVLLYICNRRDLMGDRCNGWLSNLLGAATLILMSVCSLSTLIALHN